jgi:hypothetical protein
LKKSRSIEMGIEKSFETSQTPHLIVEQIHGNMTMNAWSEARVMVSGHGNNYRYKQEGDEIRLEGFENCRIFVPFGANVTLGEVHGNASIVGVRGQLTISEIHGNFRSEEVGTSRFGRIGGEFSIRDVAGPLVVGNVGGNFRASEVKGNVQWEHCSGNGSVSEIEGHVSAGKVRGNLNATALMSLSVESVSGNLNVKEATEKITIQKVGGNLSIIDCVGDVDAEYVGGEVKMRDSVGALRAKVGGNAKLNLLEITTPNVSVQAGGEIRCRVPLAVDAQVSLSAGHTLTVKNLPLPEQWDSRQMEFVLGGGEGQLVLEAGHSIKLVGADEVEEIPDWDVDLDFQFQGDFNERATVLVQQVADQVEAQVEAFTRQLNERLSQLDSGDAIAAKVQQKVQSAMRQAEEKIAETVRRAERQAERAERHAERHAAREERYRVRVMPPTPPTPPTPGMAGRPGAPGFPFSQMLPPQSAPTSKPKRNPPSAEERMMVLKMLEEGKISVEQAEQLLAAMGE